jgi:hypothetical protein
MVNISKHRTLIDNLLFSKTDTIKGLVEIISHNKEKEIEILISAIDQLAFYTELEYYFDYDNNQIVFDMEFLDESEERIVTTFNYEIRIPFDNVVIQLKER